MDTGHWTRSFCADAGNIAGLGNSLWGEVMRSSLPLVPDASIECPRWLKIDAFHVPVFNTPKTCVEMFCPAQDWV